MKNFAEIEAKWQKRWETAKIFDADLKPRSRKFFTSIIIPYVNGRPHIGHTFTYSRTDAYARFKRAQGHNVLLAVGFHATGEPILGTIDRLKKNDASQIETFRMFGVSDAEVENFKARGPEYVAKYWTEKIIDDFKSIGYSIDWRRTFITAITPQFNRFIEWQYNTLRKKGYVTQGTHPVIWCPQCQSPTGDHDRLEGVGESPIEYVVLKFKIDNEILPAATLRPETIYGVVNMWVHPDVEYVKVRVDDETWIISEDAAKKLADQLKRVEILGRIRGSDLIGKRCVDPLSGRKIPILPAHFVDPCNATGIVMSVPSHAPWDWAALKEILDKPEELERFGVTKAELEPISLIKTPGYGEHPAIEICERMGITSTKQQKLLDDATSELYKKEFHLGVLKNNCGEFAGMKVSAVKDHLIRDFVKARIAGTMWEVTAPVVCRCTTKNYVKILENQWFLKFSDKEWKDKARKCLAKMTVYPEEARHQFSETISWLRDKACTRKTGLGTPLPWDKSWIIETLSDSTIYMAYYTIARIINEKKIDAKKLTDEVFDHIFFGIGDASKISKESDLDKKILKEMRAEFEHWYPVDMRNSGKDLVANHLTFFILHHTAVWKEKYWPGAIGVNGFVNVEGEKMSKSKGNIIPLRDLVKQYGADLTRLNITTSAEGLDDADWRAENIKSLRSRIEFLFRTIAQIKDAKGKTLAPIDRWLRSRTQGHIKNATAAYETMRFRSAAAAALFDATNDLKWYLNRSGDVKKANKAVLRETLSEIVRLLAPLSPHVCEELWQALGNKGFVAVAKWPTVNKKLINKKAEAAEELITQTLADVREICRIVKKPAKQINIYPKTAPELKALFDARDFFARQLGCKIDLMLASLSKSEKAARAKAGKPGIEIV